MKSNIYIILIVFSIVSYQAHSQGCVAIRSMGGNYMLSRPQDTDQSSWIFSTSSRYFKSFRHFSGTTENKDRLKQHTEVINYQASIDMVLMRIINSRWSFMIDVPVLSNTRSSLYEHGLVNGVNNYNERHSTHSFGIGDVRFAIYKWILDPKKNLKGNVQIGLGMKLPTGNYNYQDYWYNVGPGGSKELRTVDQSIQLGDGGTGFTVEANAFYNIASNFGTYGNFYYLVNPREQNGTRTYRETLVSSLANEAIMSVPDQYMFRAGVNYSTHVKDNGLSAAIGARLEGIPVHDLVGGSGDFRRPGYIWSAEPSITYFMKRINVFVSVPIAIIRNRTQSVTDKENSEIQQKHVQGDAAFSDYVVNAGFSVRL